MYLRKFIFTLKRKAKSHNPSVFTNSELSHELKYVDSVNFIIRAVQVHDFAEVFEYFENPSTNPPQIVNQMNLTVVKGIIRVKIKFSKNRHWQEKLPMLLHKSSPLASLIIRDYHTFLSHADVYKVLSLIRQRSYIPSGYMLTKKQIKRCITCKRLYGRSTQINQNDYREFQIIPSEVPFRDVALDHIGPFEVYNDQSEKV